MPLFHVDELISITTWNDIAERPLHISSIEAKKYLISHVIAVYTLEAPSARCSVSDCEKDHSKGFLLVTTNGDESNICEDCASRLLKITYKKQETELRAKGRVRVQKVKLNTFLSQSEEIKARISELKLAAHGGNWLYSSQSNFKKSYPYSLVAKLKDFALESSAEAVAEGAETDESMPDIFRELEGVEIFATDIRDLLVALLRPLKELEELASDPESKKMLTKYCTWADNLEDLFAEAENVVDQGQLFFSEPNMERLKKIPLSPADTKRVSAIHWCYEDAMVKKA